jgi:hypothetical protein
MHSSPLILGNDLRYMSDETVAIITNRDLIALDQDALGHTAEVVSHHKQTPQISSIQYYMIALYNVMYDCAGASDSWHAAAASLQQAAKQPKVAACSCVFQSGQHDGEDGSAALGPAANARGDDRMHVCGPP